MKKYLKTIFSAFFILIILGIVFLPQVSHAQAGYIGELIGEFTQNSIFSFVSSVANLFLMLTGGLTTIAGTFLSISINITTHIKDIYETASGIKSIWVTVRDLSSMFIIFALLYVSIQMILGLKGANFGQLVVKVFIAGILINFSLFFVKIAVDASNLVSLQFYEAISPGTAENFTIEKAFVRGGLSDIFMQSLKIQTIYSTVNFKKGADVTLGIIFAAVGGMIMMLTAAFSFFAASIAFIARTAILLAIMALSPLYFAGLIFPQIKKAVSDRLFNMLYSQCIVMPVYLFLLYVSLRIISDPGFLGIFTKGTANTAGGGFFGAISLGIIVQYVIAILFINFPLVAAIALGGVGMKWAPDAKSVSGFFGQYVFGRTAKSISDSGRFKDFASRNPSLGVLAGKGLSTVSSASFAGTKGGYDKRLKESVKTQTDFGKKLGYDEVKVKAGLADFDTKLVLERAKLKRAEEDISKLDKLTEQPEIRRATEQARQAREKILEMEGKGEKGREKLEANLKKARSTEFAERLPKGISFTSKKSRKEAADAVRKDATKGKKEKIFDDLAKELKGEEEPKEEKEEKPK